MTGLNLLPIFMIGLLGSVHCVGMCGGIVGALSLARPRFPVAVVTLPAAGAVNLDAPARVLSYNLGRIGSYALAGALAGGLFGGGLFGGVRWLSGASALQTGGYWLANLMLVALGLYLMNAWHGLAYLELAGQGLWRRVQPLIRALPPPDRPSRLLVAGALWGWLPCGLVYSVLMTAMLTGTAASGALVMLVFGLGTLPMLFALGMAGTRLRASMQRPAVRRACGVVVLAFGVLGLARAANGLPASWLDVLCLVPPAAAGHFP